jgi:trans-2,3-dihydro-3-hydroxyanthranilate isomerase
VPFPYLHYDVFTREPLLGNQLAVFTDARGMDSALMQRIAREMNFSESTFILPAEQEGTDVRMRIFTPFNEMPMAGHPTVGSTFALAHGGAITPGASRFVFGLNIGPTPVDLEWDGDRLRFAWMTQKAPAFGKTVDDRAAVAAALGVTEDDLAHGLPIQQVSCGVPFLFVPMRDRDAVDRTVSDTAAFKRLARDCGVDVPLFIFAVSGNQPRLTSPTPPVTNHEPPPAETVYSRMFAPDFGITEDPATGGASGPLGCYLVHHGVVSGAAAQRIVSMQGVAMGRASRIHIAVDGTRESMTGVRVGGEAVLVGRGELFV